MTGQDIWYIAREGKQHGPLSDAEMTKLVELGHLKPSDLVWRPGFEEWRAAADAFPQVQPATPSSQSAVSSSGPPASNAPAAKTDTASATSAAASSSASSNVAASAASAYVSPQPIQSKFDVSKMAGPAAATQTQAASPTASPTGQGSATPQATPTLGAALSSDGFWPAPTQQLDTQAASRPLVVEPQRWADPRPQENLAQATLQRPMASLPAGERPLAARAREKSQTSGQGGGARVAAVGLGVLAIIGGGAFAAFNYQNEIRSLIASLTAPAGPKDAIPSEPASSEPYKVPATPDATSQQAAADPSLTPAAVSPAASDAASAAPASSAVDDAAIDARLQKVPLWSLLKAQYPDWYGTQVGTIRSMTNEKKGEEEITRSLLTALVDLRRKNATEALSASTPKLMEMATAFVANLKAMQGQSVEACYGFISKGEATPEAATMLTKPDQAQPLQKQLEAVFAAAAEGRVSPMTRQAPQKKDYDLLAAELGTIGWSEADMQLFADPKALAQAPKDQVCKMVQDWFQAHLAVKDAAAQERLLHETLRAVVAG
ncbi:MAG: GYF domain-containing protein [Hyphomicrobium sp.]|nr:GYF domain-containing protein [Hyphomicrobium sp.]